MLVYTVLAVCLSQAEAPPPPPPAAETWPPFVHGSFSLRYRHRRTSDAEDTDLYQFLQLRAGEPDVDPLSASLSVRFAEDLDGTSSAPGFQPFDSLDDTYSSWTARLYTAYVDVHPDRAFFRARAGRQILEDLPESLPFDGGLVRALVAEEAELAVFGGLPVNLFESSTDGDLTYGGWAAVQPWRRARIRAEYLHLEDENLFGAFDDDLLGATFEQGLGSFFFWGRHTWLEREGREAVLRLSGAVTEWGSLLDLRARYAYERQQALSYAIDPYATFLTDVQPHLDLSLRASQAVGRHFILDGAVTERRFVRGGEEGLYNHEFTRWSLGPRLEGWPFEELSLTMTFDWWDSTEDDFGTLSADVACRLYPGLTAAVGSAYALYVVDALTGEERDRVRTYSVSLRWALDGVSRLDLRFTLEENELDDWRVLEMGIRHAF